MNYMEQVAHMLGVELDEEFVVPDSGLIYKFTDSGLLMKYYTPNVMWLYNNNMLRCLLNGECTLTKFKGWDSENIKTIVIKDRYKDVEK